MKSNRTHNSFTPWKMSLEATRDTGRSHHGPTITTRRTTEQVRSEGDKAELGEYRMNAGCKYVFLSKIPTGQNETLMGRGYLGSQKAKENQPRARLTVEDLAALLHMVDVDADQVVFDDFSEWANDEGSDEESGIAYLTYYNAEDLKITG